MTENFKFVSNNSGEYEIEKYIGKESVVVIPEMFNGLPVVGIGRCAFGDCEWLIKVIVSDNITYICDSAFYNCENLEEIILSENLKSIGNKVFSCCRSLVDIVLPNKLDYVGEALFSGCGKLKNVTLPIGLKVISDFMFYDCNSLVDIKIPDSVTCIGQKAFYDCDNLLKIRLPKNLILIKDNAFTNCRKLVEIFNESNIEVVEGNCKYGEVATYALNVYTPPNGQSKLSSDGNGYVFYTDRQEKILVGYTGKDAELILPDTITRIYKYAFFGNDFIQKVVICDGVTAIEEYSFGCCGNLVKLVIPDSLVSICENAFEDSDKLVEVYNRSKLKIVAGGADYGRVGQYALNVYTPSEGQSKLFKDKDGFVIYSDIDTKILVGYAGDEKCLNIPDYVDKIYKRAFLFCEKINEAVIPENIEIGTEAFYYCKNLTKITFKS